MEQELPSWDSSGVDVGGEQRDELFTVLSDERRRFLLHYLQSVDVPVSVDELTAELSAWEAQRPISDSAGHDATAIEIDLVHTHLPKMEDTGFIDYNDTERVVALSGRTGETQAYLRTTASD